MFPHILKILKIVCKLVRNTICKVQKMLIFYALWLYCQYIIIIINCNIISIKTGYKYIKWISYVDGL
jgi:uncharacterized membrane protein